MPLYIVLRVELEGDVPEQFDDEVDFAIEIAGDIVRDTKVHGAKLIIDEVENRP